MCFLYCCCFRGDRRIWEGERHYQGEIWAEAFLVLSRNMSNVILALWFAYLCHIAHHDTIMQSSYGRLSVEWKISGLANAFEKGDMHCEPCPADLPNRWNPNVSLFSLPSLRFSCLLCFFTPRSCTHLTPPPFSTLCHLLPGSMCFPVQHITLHPCMNQGRNKDQRRRLALWQVLFTVGLI